MKTTKHTGKDWSYLSISNKDKKLKRIEDKKLAEDIKNPKTIIDKLKKKIKR